jgi:hypothetical protein
MLLTGIGLLVLSISPLAQNAAQPEPSAVIATVNGEPVTQADVNRVRRAPADIPLGRSLVDLIDERLLVQRGKSLGYAVSDQQYQVILENLKKMNHVASDEQLYAGLTRSNMTPAQLRTNLERTVIASRVQQTEGLAQLSVTDEDARRYFNGHLDEFSLQTFEAARGDVIARLKADKTTQDSALKPYLRSLRSRATVIWSRPDLQAAYEQAAQ